MRRPAKPPLPPAVEARMAERRYCFIEIRKGEGALDRFLNAVDTGDVPELGDIRIVAAMLKLVLSKKQTFGRAFGLQAGQGRKKSKDIEARNQWICAEVEELRKGGWKLEDATKLVSERYIVTVDYVEKLHKSRNKEQRDLLEHLQRTESGGKN